MQYHDIDRTYRHNINGLLSPTIILESNLTQITGDDEFDEMHENLSEMLLKTNSLGVLGAKQKKAMHTVVRNVEKLEALVGDVLDVYKLDLGKLTLSKYDVDIAELINRTISDLTPFTVEKSIELKSDIRTAKEDSVFCDQKRIEQVLSNLVKNSVDFVPDKGGRIIIRVEKGRNANSEFIFTVEDNDIGITPGETHDLFNKFYQADTRFSRKHGGTGLGLTICRGIVDGVEKSMFSYQKILYGALLNPDLSAPAKDKFKDNIFG
jgi:signal transduction histidine kinase